MLHAMVEHPRSFVRATQLPTDPDLRQSMLPNGLRLWTRYHPHPPGQIVLQLRIHVGSLYEEEEERGAAHFIEHLAFQGTEDLPHGELETLVEALGTRLGRDHNAFTSFEQTTFWMSFPEGGEEVLEKGLFCLSQIARALLLDARQIERERLVILEEMRGLEGPTSVLRGAAQELLAPGSRLVTRPVIGVEQSLRELDRGRLESFYDRWYRPDNAHLLLVGDLNHDRALELASQHMAAWTATGSALPAPPRLELEAARETRARIVLHPEAEDDGVRYIAAMPTAELRNEDDLFDALTEAILLRCFDRRLRWARRECGLQLRSLEASVIALTRDLRMSQLAAFGSPGSIPAMSEFLARETRRAECHAFSDQELDFARHLVARATEQRARREDRASAVQVARRLHGGASESQAPPTAKQQWEIARKLLPSISAHDTSAKFDELFGSAAKTVLVSSARKTTCSERELIELASSWEGRDIEEPSSSFEIPALSTSSSEANLEQTAHDRELDVYSYRDGKGFRLHFRPMDRIAGEVFVEASIFGGRIEERKRTLGRTFAAAAAFSDPSLERFSPFEVRDFVQWANLRFSHWVHEDRIRLALACSSADLGDGLALLAALIKGILLTQDAYVAWRARSLGLAEQARESLETRLAESSVELLTAGDPRFRLLESKQIERLSYEQAREWLRLLMRERPLEIAVAGDIDPRRMKALADEHLAGLSPRSSELANLAAMRELRNSVAGPQSLHLRIPAESSRAAVFCGWRTAPWRDAESRRALFVATDILQVRLHEEIRNRLGLTYSVQCAFSPSRAYPSASLLSEAFITEPGRTQEGLEAARVVSHRLAEDGPGEREVENARERFASKAERSHETPRYWARVLSELAFRGLDLGELARVPNLYREVRAEHVKEVLGATMEAPNRMEVTLEPLPPGEQPSGDR